jgi:hypothetical protein
MNRMGLSLQRLLQYADEGEDMLNRIVTGTNHGCMTINPNQSMLQSNGNIPVHLLIQPKKLKVTPSAGKVMLTVSWDSQGILLAQFRKRGGNVNSAS